MKPELFLALPVVLGLAALAAPSASAVADDLLLGGGLRIARIQSDVRPGDNAGNGVDAVDRDPDDGGFDWFLGTSETEHSASSSPATHTGLTALGALRAYRRADADPRLFRAALIAAGRLEDDRSARNPDLVFRVALSRVARDPSFREAAHDLWKEKITRAGGARAYAEAIREARDGEGNAGIYPWDFFWALAAARALHAVYPGEGFAADGRAIAEVLEEDLESADPVFRMEDRSQLYHTLGLSGVILAFRLVRAGTEHRERALESLLLEQNEDGGFAWNADFDRSDPQATAYAIFALSTLPRDPRSLPAAQGGSDWLAALVTPLGGFEFYAGTGGEHPSVDAEICLALSRVPASTPLVRGPNDGPSSGRRAPVAAPL